MGNKVNARILALIRRCPMNPRDLSYNLNKKEGDIVRRLKKMEKLGLVKSTWGSRLGQNVKLYSLTTHDIGVKVSQEGLEVQLKKEGDSRTRKQGQKMIEPVDSEFFIPLDGQQRQQATTIVGREEELKLLQSRGVNFFFLVGIAGIGKTALVSRYVTECLVQSKRTKVFWHTFKEIDTLTFLVGRMSAFLSSHNIKSLLQYLDLSKNSSNDLVTSRNPQYDSQSLDISTSALNKLNNLILVFDDYHKVRDENISVFLRHLQKHSKNKIIIVSRSKPPFFLDNVHSKELNLPGLTFDDSKKMITKIFGGIMIDEATMTTIWKKFKGHPMALKIFCLFANEKKGVKDKADLSNNNVYAINGLLQYFQREILEILNEDELNILLRLSVFRIPVRAQALKSKTHQRNLNYLIHSLEKKLILNRTDNQEFFLHDMLKDVLYSMLTYPEEIHRIAAEYYLSENSSQSVIESLYHLVKSHDINKVFRILEEEVKSEKYRFIEEGYAAPLLDILRQISTSNIAEKDKLVYLYVTEGKALSMLEKWDEAKERLREAVKIATKLSRQDNREGDLLTAYALRIVSESLYLQGDFDSVEKDLLNSAYIFQKYNNTEKLLQDIYMKLARLYFATGRHEESKSYSDMAKSLIVNQQ
jgi:ATP/maltotriose-dependent transcriptional regulator MalT/DNA-binding PadR family transcriptional regulator